MVGNIRSSDSSSDLLVMGGVVYVKTDIGEGLAICSVVAVPVVTVNL